MAEYVPILDKKSEKDYNIYTLGVIMIAVNKYRTNTCGELRIADVGKKVTLSGWVDTIRRLGGLTFVTLRDHFGLTQLNVRDEAMFDGISKESVICVQGQVIERESKNKNMPTGDIEILVESVNVLGKCTKALPFEIGESNNSKEDLRLKYRFLDLRNENTFKIIDARSKMLLATRQIFHDLGFTEVQTPILTSSSPEGARDFLVPSRLNPHKFYALPQAPQQFKQLLMVSGFDRYFQIAPCFRDEDSRADRSPGEFYQADFEMSFATQDDVFATLESIMTRLVPQMCDKEMSPAPFERIPYIEAMDKYCSDKPDLRNPLICHDLTDILINTEFNAFKGKTIKAICAHTEGKPRSFYDEMTKYIIDLEGKGLAYIKVGDELSGSVVKFLSDEEKVNILARTNAQKGDAIFIIADTKRVATKLCGTLRNRLGKELGLIDENKLHFCWVVDFPFYEWNDDTEHVDFSHNPFTLPQGGMDSLMSKDPLEIFAYQYDLVLNGVELASGAVRNHDPEIMVKAFEIAGYDKSVVENKFPALYNAFSYGAPPHAGAAFGFDRLLMIFFDCEYIRDVIAFPLNKSGQDVLMGAPNTVSEKQLKDVHIRLDEGDK